MGGKGLKTEECGHWTPVGRRAAEQRSARPSRQRWGHPFQKRSGDRERDRSLAQGGWRGVPGGEGGHGCSEGSRSPRGGGRGTCGGTEAGGLFASLSPGPPWECTAPLSAGAPGLEGPSGEAPTYVNIPASPSSRKQLHYLGLELGESGAGVQGVSPPRVTGQGARSPGAHGGLQLSLARGSSPNPLVPPNAGPGPQSSLGGPTERTVGGAPRPDALSWLRPLLGDGALQGGLGLPSLGWLTGGCFQGLEPPAMHRLTSWPQQRPTGRGLSTHGPGRSGWPRWSPRRRTRAEPAWPGSGDASLREVAS